MLAYKVNAFSYLLFRYSLFACKNVSCPLRANKGTDHKNKNIILPYPFVLPASAATKSVRRKRKKDKKRTEEDSSCLSILFILVPRLIFPTRPSRPHPFWNLSPFHPYQMHMLQVEQKNLPTRQSILQRNQNHVIFVL